MYFVITMEDVLWLSYKPPSMKSSGSVRALQASLSYYITLFTSLQDHSSWKCRRTFQHRFELRLTK